MTAYGVELRERDIDAFGHVHYAEYLVFLAQARNWWFRDAGIERPGDHVVARLEVDFLASARLADGRVLVEVEPRQVGRSSLTLREVVCNPEGRELVRLRSVVVRFDPEERHPVPWTAQEGEQLRALVRSSPPPAASETRD